MDIIRFETIDSTSSFLKRECGKTPSLSFVVAQEQTEGRGRMGRLWDSAKGENLSFSLIIKEKPLIQGFPRLSVVAAYAVMKTLEALGVANVTYKWPNDVYVNGSKICGILLDGVSEGDELKAVIIGIGLNVNQKKFGETYSATSLSLALGREIGIKEVEDSLFPRLLSSIKEASATELLRYLNEKDFLKGKTITAIKDGKQIVGTAKGLDTDFSLILDDGKEITNLFYGEATIKK